MSEPLVALHSMAPVICGSTALVVLILVLQSFAIDVVKHVNAFGPKLAYRNKRSSTGA